MLTFSFILAILATFSHLQSSVLCENKIIYFPLDERFATRGMFLNLASSLLTTKNNNISTPSADIITHYKQPANLSLIDVWFDNEIKTCQNETCLIIMSSEMYIYGGLINSRISNVTLDSIINRLDLLQYYKSVYNAKLKIYFSNVIMRIPAYNGDFEEPWYWQNYGYLLYEWSFYIDKYYVLHNESDYEIAFNISKQIPSNALDEFVWRRSRNHAFTMKLLEYQREYEVFEKIWITLDDNAEYGLNRYEEREIRECVSNLSLSAVVNIYPGADEVGLVMLSKAVVDQSTSQVAPNIKVVYRNETNKNAIPNYEGQALNMSIFSQLNAAGATLVNNSDYDILLLVNNWSTSSQHEAAELQTPQDYTIFEQFASFNGVIIFADVLYSNGGDKYFLDWLETSKFKLKFGNFTYAGWNTAGNTIGTCISNGILLYLTKNVTGNKLFTYYRLIEDIAYQAIIRQSLSNYLQTVSSESISQDFEFYEEFVAKGFSIMLLNDQKIFDNGASNLYKIENVYYPWNRTFEIGFEIQYTL